MKDYVFTLAKTSSTLTKNDMNSIIKLTLWSQDRSSDTQRAGWPGFDSQFSGGSLSGV
jgi:hypothetical protein